MIRSRVVVLVIAAIVALAYAGDAVAENGVAKLKIRVELPPGVKGSEVTVNVSPGLGDRRLDDKGELEVDAPAGLESVEIKLSGPNGLFGAKNVWVATAQPRDVVFAADDVTTEDAFNAPDKVFARGKAAAARGDTAGVKAAADELERGAKAVARYGVEYEQQIVYNGYRKELEDLPPAFVDDFFRDLGQARTPEDRQRVIDKYRNGATLKAPDTLTSPEFRQARDKFLKYAKDGTFTRDYRAKYRQQATAELDQAHELRQMAATPPGHGAVPQPAGTPPKFPGDTTPGVPGSPVRYARLDRPDFWAQFGAGVAFFETAPVGYATQRTGAAGTETYIAETSGHGTGYRIAGDGGVALGDRAEIVGHAAFRHADFEANGYVPIGGARVATTYFDRASNDSSGIDMGTTGSNASVHGTLSKYEADLSYRLKLNAIYNFDKAGPQYAAGVGLGYRRFDLSYRARQTSLTFNDIHSKAWINSTTNFIGPRIDSSVAFEVSEIVPAKIEIAGYVIPGFRWGDGRAKQHSICGACGAAEQNLKIVREQSHSGFGLVAGFTTRVSVELSQDVSLGLEGGYEYTNAVNSWKIPKGPFEAPADLATEPVKIGYVGVTLRVNF